ncbi:unknown [Bacteroides sp. CAG:754]|nr:unknown [Bacteroides sp. CAG:754]
MQAVAEQVSLKSGFPGFYLFPTEIRVGQICQLVSRINDGRLAEYGRVSVAQQRFGRIGPVQVLVSQCTVRCLNLQHIQPLDVFHEFFFAYQPAAA